VATGNDGVQLVRSGLVLVDTKVRTLDGIDGLREDSLDFYARLRSAYNQRRDAEIENSLSTGSPFDTDAFDDEGLDDEVIDNEGADDTVVEGEDAE
jgi:phospholipid-binding lipoprotein MlaA